MIALKIVYIANIVVAGWISISSVFYPRKAALTVFQNAYQPTEVIRLVGCLWLAIAILSVWGLWRPISFSPVLLVQLIYIRNLAFGSCSTGNSKQSTLSDRDGIVFSDLGFGIAICNSVGRMDEVSGLR
jgi:hypothetical protein